MHSTARSTALFCGATLGLIVMLSCIQSGSAVLCYHCSSFDDKRCGDPFTPISEFLVNCSVEYPQATFCRKIDQKVKDTPRRVFRRCAWEKHKNKDCYYGVNNYYKSEICICRTNGCNTASSARQALLLPVIVSSTLLTLATRCLMA